MTLIPIRFRVDFPFLMTYLLFFVCVPEQTYGFYFYFVIPTSISQAFNILFFALTAHHCAKVRNELQRVAHTNSDESRFKSDRRK